MIYEDIAIYQRFDFEQTIKNKFFIKSIDYIEFILEILNKGNHSEHNKLEGVGSQYLNLYRKETDECTYIVLENEQGPDTIFIYGNLSNKYKNLKVLQGSKSVDSLEKSGYLKKNKKREFVFNDLDKIRSFIRETSGTFLKEIPTTEEVLNGEQRKYIFDLSKNSFSKEKITTHVMSNDHLYTFDEQLRVFDLFNVVISGICSNKNIKFPNKFKKDFKEVSEFIEKLKKVLEE